ncbi:hypothetical protein FB451DRAFT_1191194 [Mycena latifolia]|nr:hypothetical protein FB451DRAFT_1191194 [Mycena latifolia]
MYRRPVATISCLRADETYFHKPGSDVPEDYPRPNASNARRSFVYIVVPPRSSRGLGAIDLSTEEDALDNSGHRVNPSVRSQGTRSAAQDNNPVDRDRKKSERDDFPQIPRSTGANGALRPRKKKRSSRIQEHTETQTKGSSGLEERVNLTVNTQSSLNRVTWHAARPRKRGKPSAAKCTKGRSSPVIQNSLRVSSPARRRHACNPGVRRVHRGLRPATVVLAFVGFGSLSPRMGDLRVYPNALIRRPNDRHPGCEQRESGARPKPTPGDSSDPSRISVHGTCDRRAPERALASIETRSRMTGTTPPSPATRLKPAYAHPPSATRSLGRIDKRRFSAPNACKTLEAGNFRTSYASTKLEASRETATSSEI